MRLFARGQRGGIGKRHVVGRRQSAFAAFAVLFKARIEGFGVNGARGDIRVGAAVGVVVKHKAFAVADVFEVSLAVRDDEIGAIDDVFRLIGAVCRPHFGDAVDVAGGIEGVIFQGRAAHGTDDADKLAFDAAVVDRQVVAHDRAAEKRVVVGMPHLAQQQEPAAVVVGIVILDDRIAARRIDVIALRVGTALRLVGVAHLVILHQAVGGGLRPDARVGAGRHGVGHQTVDGVPLHQGAFGAQNDDAVAARAVDIVAADDLADGGVPITVFLVRHGAVGARFAQAPVADGEYARAADVENLVILNEQVVKPALVPFALALADDAADGVAETRAVQVDVVDAAVYNVGVFARARFVEFHEHAAQGVFARDGEIAQLHLREIVQAHDALAVTDDDGLFAHAVASEHDDAVGVGAFGDEVARKGTARFEQHFVAALENMGVDRRK